MCGVEQQSFKRRPVDQSSSRSRSLARTQCGVRRLPIYRKTGNLRAVQLLLGHTKLESTVRYLGIEVDDAMNMADRSSFNGRPPLSRQSLRRQ
jgi:hypothetical protein